MDYRKIAEDLYAEMGEQRESFLGGHFISTYKDCPRRFYFENILRLTSQQKKAFFTLGSAVHAAIELHYKGHDLPTILTFAEVYIDKNVMIYEKEEVWLEDKIKAPKMVQAWYDANITSGADSRYTFIEAEKEHMINLPNGFPMTVRLDRLMRDEELNRLVPFDLKTTSRSLATPIQGMTLGDQALMYLYAVKQVYGEDPAGLITDVIYHRQLVSGLKVECTRGPLLTFAPYAVLQWEMNTVAWLSEISQKVKAFKEGIYPEEVLFQRKGGYGCKNCPFVDICRRKVQPGEVPPGFITDSWSGTDEAMTLLQSDKYADRMFYKQEEK